MRVLYVNDYSDPTGGAEHIWRRTTNLVSERGVDVRELAADTVVKHRTPWSYVHSSAFAAAVERSVRDWRPDIVHLHNYYHLASPSVLAALRSARVEGHVGAVVVTAHDFHLLCPSPGLLRWKHGRPEPVDPAHHLGVRVKLRSRWDEDGWVRSELRAAQHVLAYDVRSLQETIDVVLCPSRYLAQALAPLVKTEVLANPVPASVSAAPRQGPLRVLFAGRLVAEKGLVPFLEAAPASFLDRLVVAGTGREEERAKAVAEQRGVDTTFLGWVNHHRALELAAEAHIALLPSLSPENAPNTLFEALSRGANIMGSDVGGIREIVRETGVGFLFDPQDPNDIVRAVHEVEQAHADGTLNDIDVEHYLDDRSEDRYVDRLVHKYEELTTTPSRQVAGSTLRAPHYTSLPVPDPRLPNALYIGVARAGSTWLSEVLRHHPDVYVPSVKDLYFFDREYARGLDWYRQFFDEGTEHKVRIEFSHDYFHVPYVPARIGEALGSPQLLVTLREPVSWVVSTYQNMRRNGAGGDSFGWAVSQQVGLVAGAMYSRYLRLWMDAVPRDTLKILLFDDLCEDPQRFLDDVVCGLGLAPMLVPGLDGEAVNAAAEARWAPAARTVRAGAQVVRRMGQPKAVGRLKRSPVVRRTLYREPRGSEPVSDEVTDALRTFFRPDVHELAELTGIDVVERWGY